VTELLDLAQAGPVAILLVGIAAVVRAFVTGAIVPGWIYRAEVEQRVKAETQAERNADALAALAKVAANGTGVPGASQHG
jgi:hypothetical protein